MSATSNVIKVKSYQVRAAQALVKETEHRRSSDTCAGGGYRVLRATR